VLMICSGRVFRQISGGAALLIETRETCQHYFFKSVKKIP
jgi:hypothetical protein